MEVMKLVKVLYSHHRTALLKMIHLRNQKIAKTYAALTFVSKLTNNIPDNGCITNIMYIYIDMLYMKPRYCLMFFCL